MTRQDKLTITGTKLESSCKKCDKFPCQRPQNCNDKWDYVEQIGKEGMQAVDMDHGYRLIPK